MSMKLTSGFAAGLASLALTGCDDVMKTLHGGASPHAAAAQHAPASGTTTVDLQGGYDEWRASPYIHQFYDLTKGAFANGPDKVDFASYQEKSYAIFSAFGGADGRGKAGEEAMLDHLKDIPRQIVGIVKDDPSVLESYDTFWIALSGPP
jgi:hypothetical protein